LIVRFGVDSSMPNYTLIDAGIGVRDPETVNFTIFGNIKAQQCVTFSRLLRNFQSL